MTKKLRLFTTAIMLSSSLTFTTISAVHASDTVTNTLAYTLAQTLYASALLAATSEASSLATSSKNLQKKEALKLQNEVQEYYQTGEMTAFLQSKVKIAQDLEKSLSIDESIDQLIKATQIVLAN